MKKYLLFSAVLMMCCMTASAVGTLPSGEGTSVNPYQIATKDNLLWFADYVNQGNVTVCAILTEDITVNNGVLDSNGNLNGDGSSFSVWIPIGNWGDGSGYKGFAGEFNGDGHTISGLYFSDDTRSAVGLFGMADNDGYIHDVGITDSYFRGKSHVAGICGDLAYGRIKNCWNGATVIGTSGCAGGITGSCYINSSMSGCYNIGKVSSTNSNVCGGICGSVTKNVDDRNIYVSNCVSLEGKCDRAYNLSNGTDISIISNVSIQNSSAFANGTVCGLLERHSAEFIDGYIPTATTKGRYGHWHCRLCGKDFLDEACTTQATDAALTVPVAKNTEIWYTTTDNKKLTPNKTDVFGATYNDADNVYEKGLGKITFAGDVTSIGDKAFESYYSSNCKTLQSITIPSSVTSIGAYAFEKCSNLTSVTIPISVIDIGDFAFSECTKLGSVTLPENLTGMGDYVFRGCSQLQSITIPGSVKSMGNYVFISCMSLNNVTIEDGAYIGECAFQNYKKTLTINGSLSGVGTSAFNGCTGLTSVSVKSGSIGDFAFKECSNLSAVTLKDGVTHIGQYAFASCPISQITIPGSVKSMGVSIFSNCTGLNTVTIGDGACIGGNVFEKYAGTIVFKGGLSGAGGSAFAECNVLTAVSIASGSIGSYAFADCTNLSAVTLGEDVTAIEGHAFKGCTKLESISIENGSIGESAFSGCTGLTTVTIKSGSIGNKAFDECNKLSTVTLQEGVTSIGEMAFNKCSQLQSITIPGSVKSMGVSIFSNCTGLNTVTIGDGAYIGGRVFINYQGTITLNGDLSGAGEFAFQGCPGLTSVSFESGNIGWCAFDGCTNICTITLQKDVTGIDIEAFASCVGLKEITVKWTEAEKIPAIPWEAFRNVEKSKVTLHIPTNTTALYQAKDVWKDFKIVEDVNFIITKTDDTTISQKIVANGAVTIDERSRNIKSLMVTEEMEHVSVTYIRNFANAGKWQAWYVPFDVDVADMAQAGLNVAEIYGILLDNSGNTVLAFLKMNAGTVKANTPYVVRPKEYGDVTVTTTTTLYPTKATQFAINSAKDTYTFGGIYEQTTTPGKWYAVNTSGQFQKMGTGVYLSPMRIWMTIDPRDDNPYTQPTEANAKMDIMVIGDDAPTGIESLTPALSQGEGTIYNLNGQRVKSITSGQIYIMNGKKYMAR